MRSEADTVVLDDEGRRWLCGQAVGMVEEGSRKRVLLGIAGIGGSGKSGLAADLAKDVNAMRRGWAVVVGMDGFHYSNAELARRGLREKKGAAETFDVGGFVDVLEAVRGGCGAVRYPIYDRGAHDVVGAAMSGAVVGADERLVIVEGNYLLLEDGQWSRVGELLDRVWFLDTAVEQAREWIIARHVAGGRSALEAARWYEQVDGPNAARILASRVRADLLLGWR